MKFTGKYDSITSEYDVDHKINQVADLTRDFIIDLIDEVGEDDYKKIAAVIIDIHQEKINDISIDGQEFYELMQSYRIADMTNQENVVNKFNNVKNWIKLNFNQK